MLCYVITRDSNIKSLANGINYFTEEKCEDDSILNDKDIIRTLYEIGDQLKNIVPDKIKNLNLSGPMI